MSNSVNPVKHLLALLFFILVKRRWKGKEITYIISYFLPFTHSCIQTKWDWRNVHFPQRLSEMHWEISFRELFVLCSCSKTGVTCLPVWDCSLHLEAEVLGNIFVCYIPFCVISRVILTKGKRRTKCSVLSPLFWSGLIPVPSKLWPIMSLSGYAYFFYG